MQDRVGPAVGRRHARHEEEARRRRKLARLADRARTGSTASSDCCRPIACADAVERFALAGDRARSRRVVLRAPARVALVADVHVGVDQRRHHRLAGEIDAAARPPARVTAPLPADRGDPSVPARRTRRCRSARRVADDQPGPRRKRLRGGPSGLQRSASSRAPTLLHDFTTGAAFSSSLMPPSDAMMPDAS